MRQQYSIKVSKYDRIYVLLEDVTRQFTHFQTA